MEIGQGMAQCVQMGCIDRARGQLDAVEIAGHGETFPLKLDMKTAAFGLKRLQAWKILFS